MKWLKRIGIVLAVLLLLGVAAKFILLDRAPVPATSSYVIDMKEVRRLATEAGGALPQQLDSLVIGETPFPRGMVIAGEPFEPLPMIFTSFQVVYPDHTVIVDTAMDRATADAYPFDGSFFDDRYTTMQEAMRRAKHIVLTHEHPDHIGGVAHSPHLQEITPLALFNAEQLTDHSLESAGFPAGALEKFTPLKYERYHVVGPGVVLIRAPGHSTGSQLIYVRLDNGAEFLFVGDIAWNMGNIRQLTGRPRLLSWFMLNEDTDAVGSQLRALHDLEKSGDPVKLLVAHDKAQLAQYVDAGLIRDGFSTPQ